MGIEGAALGVKEGLQVRDSGLHLRKLLEAGLVSRSLGEHVVHAAGSHVDGPLVGVEAEPGVPVDSVKAQR